MKHKIILLLTITMLATVSLKAQLNVGSTNAADPSAILQATSTTKGFLPPVMTTAQINAIVLPANGLTVYNSTLSQLQVNIGTTFVPSWSVVAGGANVYWSQQGNTGTVPGTNYVGTTDNASVGFRTNGVERVRIDSSTGNVGIGTTTPYAQLQLANTVVNRKIVLLDQGTNGGNDSAFYGLGINAATLRYQVPAGGNHSFYVNKTIVGILSPGYFNLLNGTSGNSSFGIGRTGVEGSFSIVGVNSSYANGALAGDAVLRADTGSLYVSTFTGKPLMLRTGDVERMRITPAGNVGIATAIPVATLDVAGNMRLGTTISGASTDSILTINSSTGIINNRSLQSVNSNIYNADGTITANRTMQLAGRTLTFNGASAGLAPGINILSGNTGAWSQLGLGRTTTEGAIGIAASGAQILNAAATGDMLIWTNANNLQMGSNGAGAVVLSTGANEHFRITPAGLIGINTATPTHNFEISGSAGIIGSNTFQFGSGVAGQDAAAGRIGYQSYTAGALDIVGAGTSGSNRIVKLWDNITIPGTMGVGTSTPSAKLQVVSADNTFGTNIIDAQANNLTTGTSLYYQGIRMTGTNANNPLYLDGKGTGAIFLNANNSTGNVGIGTTFPAATLDVAGTMRIASTATAPNSDDLLTINGSGIVSRRSVASLATQTPDVSIYNTDGTLSANRIVQLGGHTLTFNGTAGGFTGGVSLLSGAGQWSTLSLGRTSIEGNISIANSGNQILNAAVPGDMLVWTNSNNLIMGANGGGAVVLVTSANEQFRLASNGNIGIKNATPSQALQVNGNIKAGADNVGSAWLSQGNSNQSGYLSIYKPDGVTRMGYIGADVSNLLYQAENGASHIFNGNTYLNNSTILGGGYANSILNISSTALGAKITLWDNGNTTNHYGFGISNGQLNYDSGGDHFFFQNGKNGSGNPVLRLSSGNSQLWGNLYYTGSLIQNSDRRLKRNIVGLNSALTQVMQLMPYSYEKKNTIESKDYSIKEIGFIAQDVRKILPQLVFEGKDSNKTLSINYIGIIPLLTKAIQEQQAQNDTQVALIKQQQVQNDSQTTQIVNLTKANAAMIIQNNGIIEQISVLTAHNKILDTQNSIISAQLTEMKELKLAMAQLRSELNKTAITKVAFPIPVTAN